MVPTALNTWWQKKRVWCVVANAGDASNEVMLLATSKLQNIDFSSGRVETCERGSVCLCEIERSKLRNFDFFFSEWTPPYSYRHCLNREPVHDHLLAF